MTPKIIVSHSNANLDSYLSDLQKTWTLSYKLTPSGKSISIKEIKELIEKISFSLGSNEQQLFIIEMGHLMTIPAQNCLLKTLEETAPNQLLLIITHLPHLLLPTITSRCLVINSFSKSAVESLSITGPTLKDWSGRPSTIINLCDQIAINNPSGYLLACLESIRTISQKQNTPNRIHIQNSLLICLDDLNKNVNPKLAIDHFFFSIRHCLSSS